MLTETFQSIATATRSVFRNWQSLLLIAVLYAAFLTALYFFVAVREASITQLILTFALALAAPLLFFVLQAMIASEGTDSVTSSAGYLLRKALTSFWKFLLISLPLIALAVLIAYLLGKAQAKFGTVVSETAAEAPRRLATAGARAASKPIDWRAALLSTLRYLAFGLVLPLLAIHLWLATAREGLGAAIKRIGVLLARAFAPQSVLIYIIGFIVFGVVPYFLLFRTTPNKHAWLEIFLLGARLVAAFALTLFGWVITVKSLAFLSATPLNPPANEAA